MGFLISKSDFIGSEKILDILRRQNIYKILSGADGNCNSDQASSAIKNHASGKSRLGAVFQPVHSFQPSQLIDGHVLDLGDNFCRKGVVDEICVGYGYPSVFFLYLSENRTIAGQIDLFSDPDLIDESHSVVEEYPVGIRVGGSIRLDRHLHYFWTGLKDHEVPESPNLSHSDQMKRKLDQLSLAPYYSTESSDVFS